MIYRVNTSNPGKLEEFRKFLGADVQSESRDLPEPKADQITIIRYKASQFENVLVDDVSLDVEGAELGVNIKWLLRQLPSLERRSGIFRCTLGIHRNSKIEIFEGAVKGTIVKARGKSFGFNPFFEPVGTSFTLAEKKEDQFNARYLAVQKFLQSKPDFKVEPLKKWSGEFQ